MIPERTDLHIPKKDGELLTCCCSVRKWTEAKANNTPIQRQAEPDTPGIDDMTVVENFLRWVRKQTTRDIEWATAGGAPAAVLDDLKRELAAIDEFITACFVRNRKSCHDATFGPLAALGSLFAALAGGRPSVPSPSAN